MSSSSDSQSFDSSQVPLRPQENDAERLFDNIITDDIHRHDDCDESHIKVKKPLVTYARKRRPFKNVVNNIFKTHHDVCEISDDTDSDDGDNKEKDADYNVSRRINKTTIKNNKKKPKEKKTKCTKESVLEAFEKAIKLKEIPDFSQIENCQLNIVHEEPVIDPIDDILTKLPQRSSTRNRRDRNRKPISLTTTIEEVDENDQPNASFNSIGYGECLLSPLPKLRTSNRLRLQSIGNLNSNISVVVKHSTPITKKKKLP